MQQHGLQRGLGVHTKTRDTNKKVREKRRLKRLEKGRKPQLYRCPVCKEETGRYTVWDSNRHGEDMLLADFPSYGLDEYPCPRHKKGE